MPTSDSQKNTNCTIHLWTIQMARWRLAQQQDITLLDITAKSGNRAFAPAFEDVMAYKRGELSETRYTEIYLERMARSQKVFPKAWRGLLAAPRAAYACYCPAGAFCHRLLFAKIAEEYITSLGIEVIQHGELLPDVKKKKE